MYNKLFTGPMFSGKTRRLVTELERYVIAKRHVIWFEPLIDSRGESHGSFITKRMEELKNSEYVHSFKIKKPEDVIIESQKLQEKLRIEGIFIDEFFMIPFERQFFYDYQNSNLKDIPLVFAGLIAGADSNLMPTTLQVLPFMDEIEKFNSICMNCGKDANYSYFVGDWNTADPIDDGTNYKALCSDCYVKLTKQPLNHEHKRS